MNETTINTAFLTFPWIGGAAALVLLVLLFGTRLLQSTSGLSRWHDRVWLSWLAMAAYLLHNVEEYGIDIFGRRLGFPDGICALMNLPAFPDCPIPPLYFMAVNIPLFWVAAPIAALMSRRHPLVGLAFYSVLFVNAWFHILPFVAGAGYSSGTVTALVLFVPMSVWIVHACFGPGRLSYRSMALLVALGVVFHIILVAPMQLFLLGWIGERVLIGSQLVNAVLLLWVPWLAEKWRNGAFIRPDAVRR